MRTAVYCRLSRDCAGLSENVTTQRDEATAYVEEQGWYAAWFFSVRSISY
jgi:DNA invertase Pin-like site-specific DNA recombinase